MSLRKTESQVKDLLTETILTLCRNTLNQYADVSVEGLLGVTLDKQEIFLVSINQQIENKRSEESDEAEDSVNGFNVNVSRKRANNSDGEHCSSYSNSGENTDNENNEGSRKTVRKRRRRRRSGGSNGEESCPSIQGPGFESLTFPEIQKASFLSNQSNFNVDSVDDQDDLEDELNDPAMVLRRLAEATRKINEGGSPVRIKQEVTEDEDERLENGESALVIKEEKNPEECWPSSSENNVHSTPSVFPVREKSTSDHDASLGHLSDVSGDHSMSEQGPGPSASASHSGAEDVYVPKLFYDDAANSLPIFRKEKVDSGANSGSSQKPSSQQDDLSISLANSHMAAAAGLIHPLSQVPMSPVAIDPLFLAQSMLEGFNPLDMAYRGNHKCPYCHKLFAAPNQVRRHLVVHTGEKNHECEICGARFSQKATCKTHRRRVHGLDDTT